MVAKRKTARKSVQDTEIYQVEATEAPTLETSRKSLMSRFLPLVYIVLVIMAFGLGVLYQKVQYLENPPKTATTTDTTAQGAAQPTPAPISLDQIKDLFSKDIIKFGDANKKLLVVAVEDPSCPYCHVASGKDPEINNQFGPQFKLVKDGGTYQAPIEEIKKLVDSGQASLAYIYMPGHGNGEMGQKALYCAFEKGRFWQVHDLLYSNAGYNLQNTTVLNDKTKSQVVADFLKSAINPSDMKSCLDSGKYDSRLTSDTQIAATLGVSGTPGFFVNSTRFPGAYSYVDMKSAVDTALGK